VKASAGYISDTPRREFFAHMDAANIDLKAFTEGFYRKICGGSLGTVLDTLYGDIRRPARALGSPPCSRTPHRCRCRALSMIDPGLVVTLLGPVGYAHNPPSSLADTEQGVNQRWAYRVYWLSSFENSLRSLFHSILNQGV
jgi:hypothetical protein